MEAAGRRVRSDTEQSSDRECSDRVSILSTLSRRISASKKWVIFTLSDLVATL